jgi:formate--tetrahydrofolate ligase
LYPWDLKVEEKIERVARTIYGAGEVEYLSKAKENLKTIYACGYDTLPICIAKTQNSLSDDPHRLGRPRDFTMTVREIIISAGAGFLVPLTGEMMRMPGLPRRPAAELIDIDNDGNITGLF